MERFKAFMAGAWKWILLIFGIVLMGVLIGTGIYFVLGLHKEEYDANGNVSNPKSGDDAAQSDAIRKAVGSLLVKTGVRKRST